MKNNFKFSHLNLNLNLNLKLLINCESFNKNTLFVFLASSVIFFFPVIYGQGFYADDVSRVHNGVFGWENLGRFYATDIAKFYSLNQNTIVDAAPVSWLLSILLVGLSSKLIYLKFKPKYSEFAYPLAIIFICNPFFIENLLYRYDNLGMSLALFFTVLSFCLNDSQIGRVFKILFLLVGLNFYQTFSNLFIGLVAIEVLLISHLKNDFIRAFKVALISGVIFILANVLYYFELKILQIPSRGELLTLSLGSIPEIFHNLQNAFNPLINFWSFFDSYILVLIPFIIFSVIKITISRKYNTLIGIAGCLVLIFLSSLGGMSLLKLQFVSPRGLSYFPIVLMLLTTILIIGDVKLKWVMLIPFFACFIFSARVGNMQQIQSEFEKPIFANITMDLQRVAGDIESFYSIGHVRYSNYITNIRKNTPFNGFMTRGGWHTTGRLQEYGNKKVKFEWSGQARNSINKYNSAKESMSLVVDGSPFYKVYTRDKEGWIVWM